MCTFPVLDLGRVRLGGECLGMGPQCGLETLQLGFLVLLALGLGLERMLELVMERLQSLLGGFGTHGALHDSLEIHHADLELRVCSPRQRQSQDTDDESRPHPHAFPWSLVHLPFPLRLPSGYPVQEACSQSCPHTTCRSCTRILWSMPLHPCAVSSCRATVVHLYPGRPASEP